MVLCLGGTSRAGLMCTTLCDGQTEGYSRNPELSIGNGSQPSTGQANTTRSKQSSIAPLSLPLTLVEDSSSVTTPLAAHLTLLLRNYI